MAKRVLSVVVALVMIFSLTGCKEQTESVSVQSVSMLMGIGSTVGANRYNGVVSSGKTETLNLDESMTLDEIKVEVGQEVKVGDLLFTYDNAGFLLTLEQSRLEIEGLKNSLETMTAEVEELQKQLERAAENNKLAITLQIESTQASIREAQYNIAVKEKELELKQAEAEKTEVYAPISGRVTEINEEGGYDNYGNQKAFMTIIETGNLRVKGTINEMNVGSLYEGCRVIIHSRTDETIWSGTITSIDWENPVKDNNNYYYGADEMSTSSKYPFYVTLDDEAGLFIGQHVYIEAGEVSEGPVGVALPSYFVVQDGSSSYVWAKGKDGRLEKRNVSLGDYDEMMDTYQILSGLELDDYVAFPEENLKPGMSTVEWDESMFGGAGMEGDMGMYDDMGEFDMGEYEDVVYEDVEMD